MMCFICGRSLVPFPMTCPDGLEAYLCPECGLIEMSEEASE